MPICNSNDFSTPIGINSESSNYLNMQASMAVRFSKISQRVTRFYSSHNASSESAGSVCNNKYSSTITQPKSQGASQAMLFATGRISSSKDMQKPQVGIASMWYEGNPVRYFSSYLFHY